MPSLFAKALAFIKQDTINVEANETRPMARLIRRYIHSHIKSMRIKDYNHRINLTTLLFLIRFFCFVNKFFDC